MDMKSGLGSILILVIGIVVGILIATLIIPASEVSIITEKLVEVEKPIVTEKIVTVEIERPIVTQQIVEVVKEVEVYRFIDEDYPVHKWIDPDNQAVVYIFPEGYTGEVWPMYTLVPPIWFDQMLRIILEMNNGIMPPEIINSIPKEWMEAVAPGTLSIKRSSSMD